ncbi:MAG: anti-sigma factor family protein [Alphaproteobacteria bacterium]
MSGDEIGKVPPSGAGAALWQASCSTDIAEDEAERFLDLAGYADGRLDPDDRERVAAWLAADPVAAGDIAAARRLAASTAGLASMPEPAIARACALVDGGASRQGVVIPFAPRYRSRPTLHGMAGWGSLVAAMAVASWLGFTLGVDTSRSFAQTQQTGDNGFLQELLDPATDSVRDLTGGAQT